jgi:EpsI family protein
MSTEPRPAGPSVLPLWRSLVVLALAGATVAACYWAAPPSGSSEAGVRMNLPETVMGMHGEEQEVSNAERSILPKDTEFAKKQYTDGAGDTVNCQIVLAGAEKRSIHRPEVCLPGQGWTLKSGEVVPVKLDNGKSLDVMRLTIGRPVTLNNGQQKELTSLFYYWFVGKDMTTPRHVTRILKTNLDMLLHNTNHRWAYVIVSAPILEGFAPGGKSMPQTAEFLERFISELGPDIIGPTVQLAAGK